MLNEEYTHLLQEEEKVLEEANIISLPSNKYHCVIFFTPREDHKNCTIEVRAGAGGAEACLFTEDIMNMYKNYCSLKDWKWSVLSCNSPTGGGFCLFVAVQNQNQRSDHQNHRRRIIRCVTHRIRRSRSFSLYFVERSAFNAFPKQKARDEFTHPQ